MEATKKTSTRKMTAKTPAAVTKKAKTEKVAVEATPKKARAAKKTEAAAGPKLVAAPTHDEISRRAYEIWMRHGGQHGYHGHDWALAEQELRRA